MFVERVLSFVFFFFNDTATTEIYTLSLHDALPIYEPSGSRLLSPTAAVSRAAGAGNSLSSWQHK